MEQESSPSFEFANFIADVSDSRTGQIRSDRLARWLNKTEESLIGQWRSSEASSWPEFAGDILAALDALQDISGSLRLTLIWYDELPLVGGLTAAQCVSARRTHDALRAARILRYRRVLAAKRAKGI